MSEALKSIYESFNNRLKNPFIGAFSFAFIIFKWKQIVILFSSHLNGEEKIANIIKLNKEQSGWIYICIFFTAVAYMYIPKLLMLAFESWGRNWIEEKRYKIALKKLAAKNGLTDAVELLYYKNILQELLEYQKELKKSSTYGDRLPRLLMQFKNTTEITKDDPNFSEILDLKEKHYVRSHTLGNPKVNKHKVSLTALGRMIIIDIKNPDKLNQKSENQ